MSMARKTGNRELILSAALISAVVLGGCSRETSQEYFNDAQRYHAKGDNKSAVIELKNALQKDPNNGDARFLLGEIYSETGDYAAAEDELQMAMQYEKYRKKVQIELGNVYLGRGEFQKIIDNLKIDAGMDAQTKAEVLAIRGNAYMGLGKTDEASTAFAESLKTSPGFQDALLGEARIAASQ
ncbi:MAG TPA: tetratricopeptide repeat protein, partial [Burkholderiales bacterium]|nr:tetratricopeptide repeat protein [Burkholderiales bacterium]